MTLLISWSTQTTSLDAAGDLQARSVEHTLAFDAVLSETHEGTSVLTEHAVESGAPISDHKRANPDRISIEALVTNTPLDAPPASGYGTSGISTSFNKDEAPEGAAVLLFSATFDRISDVVQTLRRLRLESTPVTVSTRIHTYENVQVVGVSTPREPGDGDSVRLNIEFQQVRIAQTRTTDTPAPREPRGTPTTDRGGQEATDAATRRQSALDAAREEYNRRREAGEGVGDALMGAVAAGAGG